MRNDSSCCCCQCCRAWIGERDGEARSLKALAASDRRLHGGSKQKYTTHETAKGPGVWAVRRTEVRRVAFIEAAEQAPDVPQELLVARNPRTSEVKYFLTNAPRSLPTPACLKVAFARLPRGALLPGLQERAVRRRGRD